MDLIKLVEKAEDAIAGFSPEELSMVLKTVQVPNASAFQEARRTVLFIHSTGFLPKEDAATLVSWIGRDYSQEDGRGGWAPGVTLAQKVIGVMVFAEFGKLI